METPRESTNYSFINKPQYFDEKKKKTRKPKDPVAVNYKEGDMLPSGYIKIEYGGKTKIVKTDDYNKTLKKM